MFLNARRVLARAWRECVVGSGEDGWEGVGSSPSLVLLRLLTTTTTSYNDCARLRSGLRKRPFQFRDETTGVSVHPWPVSALAASRGRPKRRVYPLFCLPPGWLRTPLHTINSSNLSMTKYATGRRCEPAVQIRIIIVNTLCLQPSTHLLSPPSNSCHLSNTRSLPFSRSHASRGSAAWTD